MWTAKQANNFTRLINSLSAGVIVALAGGALGARDWQLAVILLATALSGVVSSYWRRRRGPAVDDDTLVGVGSLAKDERDAYLQLRAWAVVGQTAAVAAIAAAIIAALQGPATPWLFPLFGVIVLYHATVVWLRYRG